MMSESVRLVVTDVDGTLVETHSHHVSEESQKMIAELEKNGCHVAIATARPPEYAEKVVGDIALRGLHVVDNGASVYDYDAKTYVWREWLSVKKLHEIVTALLPYAQDVIDCYPEFRMEPVAQFMLDSIMTEAPYVYTKISPSSWGELALRFGAIEGIYPSIVARDATQWHVQVCSVNGTKKHGVEHLQTLLGVTKAETLAIGDSQNDEPLFEAAEIKVAMGNATEELKARASYITSDVTDSGWANAMRTLVL